MWLYLLQGFVREFFGSVVKYRFTYAFAMIYVSRLRFERLIKKFKSEKIDGCGAAFMSLGGRDGD